MDSRLLLALTLPALTGALLGCDNPAGEARSSAMSGPDLPVAEAAASTSADNYQYRSTGEGANLFWSDGATYGYLDVSRGGPAGSIETYLSYYVYRCDEVQCETLQAGYGRISNQTFSGSLTKGQHLDVTTGPASPAFHVYAGDGGRITIDWTASPFFSSRERSAGGGSHSLEYEFPGFHVSYTFAGSSNFRVANTSADASGSVAGLAIPTGAFGNMGTFSSGYRQVMITRER